MEGNDQARALQATGDYDSHKYLDLRIFNKELREVYYTLYKSLEQIWIAMESSITFGTVSGLS